MAATYIGIENKKYLRSRRTTRGYNAIPTNFKYTGMKISENKVILQKELKSNSIYNFHRFFEEGFVLTDLPTVKKIGENKYTIPGLESPVNEISLQSLYFSKIIENITDQNDIKLVCSTKDYYDDKQTKKQNQVFSNLRIHPMIVPESTCAAVYLASKSEKDSSEKICIVNYSGEKVVLSSFEISNSSESKIKVSLTDRKVLELISDSRIETEIFNEVIRVIKEKCPAPVSYIPHETIKEQNYCDINKIVLDVTRALDSELSVFKCPELFYYNVETNEPGLISELSFNLNNFRSIIDPLIKHSSIEVPEDHTVYYITDVFSRKGALLNYNQMISDAIVSGAELINNSNVEVVDKNINKDMIYDISIYSTIKSEMTKKIEALEMHKNLSTTIESLKLIDEEAKAPLRAFIDKQPANLRECTSLVTKVKELITKNRLLEAEKVMRDDNIKVLKEAIKSANKEPENIKVQIQPAIDEATKWLEENETNKSLSNEFYQKTIQLKVQVNKAKNHIAKLEEQKKKEEEALKAAEEMLLKEQLGENELADENNKTEGEEVKNAEEAFLEDVVEPPAEIPVVNDTSDKFGKENNDVPRGTEDEIPKFGKENSDVPIGTENEDSPKFGKKTKDEVPPKFNKKSNSDIPRGAEESQIVMDSSFRNAFKDAINKNGDANAKSKLEELIKKMEEKEKTRKSKKNIL